MPWALMTGVTSARNITAATILVLGLVAGGRAIGGDEGTWPVRGKILGKKDKKSEDLSGIACAAQQGFPRSCLVIDDEIQQAQFVTVKDGELLAGSTIALIDNTFKDKALELDGEGVSYADGFYYVIGSHGHPRDAEQKLDPIKDAAKIAARIAADSQIVRFRSQGDGAVERTAKLRAMIAQVSELSPHIDRRLENNGLTIEGIAVSRGRIFAGFRGPLLGSGRAAVLSVAVDSVFGNAPPDARLHRLPLGDSGIRDLAVHRDGVLVLAGPASDPGPYAVYWWDGNSDNVKLLKDLAEVVGNPEEREAEGLLAVDESSSGLRVLILFDGEKEGAPVAITLPPQ